ncbi:putative polypeptide N-acetylgalactosaminyltransferase 10 [Limulus polyphemus]|uniref:Polypeptide N-acetylgalactosaminyltransferase n=1 Tax=Limulus polyphemus TaxID=6850 RepID=A0ABM1B0U2_LIMPO|nr:putative polypeptide N-acetylgalactosaminyltransferase 10 [Limulus polyphemus]XP_022239327.1 putative polypeptide N-acetylgalactosaminyltransferase 10 [Limulus polyphemus]
MILRRNTRRLIKFICTIALVLLMGTFVLKTLLVSHPLRGPNGEVLSGRGVMARQPEDLKIIKKENKPLKIDWHNYTQIAEDVKRKGPGEQGTAFYLPPGVEQKKDQLYKVNGFNALVSDYIALNRSLPDIRHPGCKSKLYLSKLPTASVVVPFHNEHWTTLLRTATSVLNRSPPGLVKEVILVDDFSSKEELKGALEDYIKRHFSNVRVIRAKKREGLIRARLMGAREATGDVVIFLDSHTEANVNWLPPLLEPIAEDHRTVVCPFIDVLDYETFAYRAQDEGARGSFDWELYYKRLPLLPEDLQHPTEPFRSPVMAGGLFAIDREFFGELGGYDEGLDVWGGEQYELSFKIWQCGGQMVDAPCSRIGHIYRKFAPFPNPGIGDFVGRNYKRVAEVWMDEYKEYLYKRRPHYRNLDPGNISKQRALRETLKCKPFKWFMENVAFDQPKKYPPVEPPDYAKGEIRNVGRNLCIDTRFRGQNERFNLEKCIKDNDNQGGEQQFVLTWHKDIRPAKRSVCFDVSSSETHAPVVLWSCHGMQGNQLWKYDLNNQHLLHPITGNCLDCDSERQELFMSPCDPTSQNQKWKFEVVNASALASW